VTSQIPLLALGVPTHRQVPQGGQPWSPEESIPVEASLTFYTENAAFQSFNENRFGRIEVGMQADLVHLDTNPLKVEPIAISEIKVITTYKGGIAY
jgi:hypothetical protein